MDKFQVTLDIEAEDHENAQLAVISIIEKAMLYDKMQLENPALDNGKTDYDKDIKPYYEGITATINSIRYSKCGWCKEEHGGGQYCQNCGGH